MYDPQTACNNILTLLDQNEVEYKLYQHKPILSYEDAEEVRKEVGYTGTEGKCLVLKTDDTFIVYVTTAGNKVNFNAIKSHLGVLKVKLASGEELGEHFGAVPGCAYPFGFDSRFAIFVDPAIYDLDWLLFSPALPTATVQAKGNHLKKLFQSLPNKTEEVTTFNL